MGLSYSPFKKNKRRYHGEILGHLHNIGAGRDLHRAYKLVGVVTLHATLTGGVKGSTLFRVNLWRLSLRTVPYALQ